MPRRTTTLDVLDVGQGNCHLWRSPEADIIIDANLPPSGVGQYVKGHLLDHGVTSPVDLLILTGWDRDHANPEGVGMVLRNFSVAEVWIPPFGNDTDSAREVARLLREAERKGTHIVYPTTEEFREATVNDTEITLFSPHPEDADSSNNASIVARLETDQLSALVTGDCEQGRWASIVRYFGHDLAADVLVAPHHGSVNGITTDALRRIGPRCVAVSAGDNQWGLPDAQAMRMFRQHCRDVRVTREHGTLRFEGDGTHVYASSRE